MRSEESPGQEGHGADTAADARAANGTVPAHGGEPALNGAHGEPGLNGAHDGARVIVLRSPAELEAHRALWDALDVRNIAADLDWTLAWCQRAPDVREPYVLVVEEDGEPTGLAVGRIAEQRLGLDVGGRRVPTPPARKLFVAHEGVLGSAGNRRSALVMRAWWDALRAGEAD